MRPNHLTPFPTRTQQHIQTHYMTTNHLTPFPTRTQQHIQTHSLPLPTHPSLSNDGSTLLPLFQKLCQLIFRHLVSSPLSSICVLWKFFPTWSFSVMWQSVETSCSNFSSLQLSAAVTFPFLSSVNCSFSETWWSSRSDSLLSELQSSDAAALLSLWISLSSLSVSYPSASDSKLSSISLPALLISMLTCHLY